MTDRATGAVDTRLEELAAASIEYAAFGRLGVGLSLLPLSLCSLFIGLALWSGWVEFACFMGGMAPPISLSAAQACRRWYQRHGYADESSASFGSSRPDYPDIARWVGWLVVGLWWILALFTLWALAQGRGPNSRDLVGPVPLLGALLTTMLLWWKPPRPRDGTWIMFILPGHLMAIQALMVVAGMPRGPIDELNAWVFSLMAIASGLLGAWSHRKYRRLECRLRELREGG